MIVVSMYVESNHMTEVQLTALHDETAVYNVKDCSVRAYIKHDCVYYSNTYDCNVLFLVNMSHDKYQLD